MLKQFLDERVTNRARCAEDRSCFHVRRPSLFDCPTFVPQPPANMAARRVMVRPVDYSAVGIPLIFAEEFYGIAAIE